MSRYIDADSAKAIYLSKSAGEQLDRVPTTDAQEIVHYADNKKRFGGVAIYSLFELSMSIDKEMFFKRMKERLLSQIANMVGENEFIAKFSIEKLDNRERFETIRKCQRADGQHTYRGDFISFEKLGEIVDNDCEKLVLNGYILK